MPYYDNKLPEVFFIDGSFGQIRAMKVMRKDDISTEMGVAIAIYPGKLMLNRIDAAKLKMTVDDNNQEIYRLWIPDKFFFELSYDRFLVNLSWDGLETNLTDRTVYLQKQLDAVQTQNLFLREERMISLAQHDEIEKQFEAYTRKQIESVRRAKVFLAPEIEDPNADKRRED